MAGFNAGDFGLASGDVSHSITSDGSVPELDLAELRKMRTGRKTELTDMLPTKGIEKSPQ